MFLLIRFEPSEFIAYATNEECNLAAVATGEHLEFLAMLKRFEEVSEEARG